MMKTMIVDYSPTGIGKFEMFGMLPHKNVT